MLDYLKMLQLRKQGTSINAIANAMTCKWETVERVLSRCMNAWKDLESIPDGISNEQIADRIFLARYATDESYLQPDAEMVLERQRKGELRNDLWLEYVRDATSKGKKPYKITRFNEIVSDYAAKNSMVQHISRQPGLEGQVDWVGDKAHIIDRDTGERVNLHVFVLSLPYSGYFYAEAFFDEKMASWIDGHRNAFSFFNGCPSLMVPDNCRTAITRPAKGKGEPAIINAQYAEFATHYGFLIKPARVRRPRDKAHVERMVLVVERDILKPLARHTFFSLQEFNRMLMRKLVDRLDEPYSKRTGSRSQIFVEEEQKMLLPLPVCEYQSYTEKKAVVSRDTHIQFDCAYYSVPVQYIKDTVIVRATTTRVYIYTNKRTLIAEHWRAIHKWQRITDPSHVPADNYNHSGYSRSEFIERAKAFGPDLVDWCNGVLDRFEFEIQGFRTVATVLNLTSQYHPDVVRDAARQAVGSSIFNVKGFRLIARDLQAKRLTEQTSEEFDVDSLFCSHGKGVINEVE